MNNILSVLENFSLDNADDIAIRMAKRKNINQATWGYFSCQYSK